MSRKKLISALALLTLTVGGGVIATLPATASDSKCAGGPTEKWIGIDAAAVKAAALGYVVRSIEIDDGCYEIEGRDKHGAKIKLNLDPVTGEPVPHGTPKHSRSRPETAQ